MGACLLVPQRFKAPLPGTGGSEFEAPLESPKCVAV